MLKLLNPFKLLNNTNKQIPKQFKKFNSTYKAAVIKELEKPLVIEERPLKELKLGSNQVKIQVSYCSVNSVDISKFSETRTKLPFIPGYEVAGEVIEVGKNVEKEKILVGDKVVGLNLENFGGIAEQCILEADDVWRLPSDLSRKDAAVIAYGHSMALYVFSQLAKPKKDEKIVVSAGAAGLGLAAVDIAANVYGAHVIGVVDCQKRGELVREQGAFETVEFSENLQKNIYKLSDNKGISIVYDAVGDYMLETIGTCVSVGGKVFHAAPVFYKHIPVPIPHSFLSVVSLKALRKQNKSLYQAVVSDTLEMASSGDISAHVSASFPLKDINEAVTFIKEKKCTGKVVIHVDE